MATIRLTWELGGGLGHLLRLPPVGTVPWSDTVTSYIVNWGDGIADTCTTPGAKTHNYDAGGSAVTIAVGLVNNDGTFPAAGTLTVSTVPAPSVVSLTPSVNAGSVVYTVTFSEAVAGVDAGDFSLSVPDTVTGASIGTVAAVNPVAGYSYTYTVAVTPGTGWGTLELDLQDDDTIHNAAPGGGGNSAGRAWAMAISSATKFSQNC